MELSVPKSGGMVEVQPVGCSRWGVPGPRDSIELRRIQNDSTHSEGEARAIGYDT